MVGCNDAHFPKVKAILEHMGKNIVHCGATGMGEAAKICNNMLMAISMIGVSEAMNLGLRCISLTVTTRDQTIQLSLEINHKTIKNPSVDFQNVIRFFRNENLIMKNRRIGNWCNLTIPVLRWNNY